METLIQTKNFVRRNYRISDSKLFLNVEKFGNSDEIEIRFENIEGEKVSSTKSNETLRGVALIFVFIGIVTFSVGIYHQTKDSTWIGTCWILGGIALIGIYYQGRDSIWKLMLNNGNFIQFHKKIPNKKEVDDFITTLILSRNQYLKDNYYFVDENLKYEGQLESFKWLKNISAINKKEFDLIYKELKETVKPKQGNIGFNV